MRGVPFVRPSALTLVAQIVYNRPGTTTTEVSDLALSAGHNRNNVRQALFRLRCQQQIIGYRGVDANDRDRGRARRWYWRL